MSTPRVRRRARGTLRRPRARRSTSPSTTSCARARDPRHAPAVERLWRALRGGRRPVPRRPTRATTASGASGSTPPTSSSTAAAPSTARRSERVGGGELVLPAVPLPAGDRASRSRRASSRSHPRHSATRCWRSSAVGSTTSACRAPSRRARGLGHPGARRSDAGRSTSGSTRSPTTSSSLDFGDPASEQYRRVVAARRPTGCT